MVNFREVKTNMFHLYQISVFILPPEFYVYAIYPLGEYLGYQINQ